MKTVVSKPSKLKELAESQNSVSKELIDILKNHDEAIGYLGTIVNAQQEIIKCHEKMIESLATYIDRHSVEGRHVDQENNS